LDLSVFFPGKNIIFQNGKIDLFETNWQRNSREYKEIARRTPKRTNLISVGFASAFLIIAFGVF